MPPSAPTVEPQELWKPPTWFAFAWGFAEATLFFIIPDVVLSWASLAGARDGVRALLAIIAGAVVGGLLMFTLAVKFPDQTRHAVASVPFVRTTMVNHVEREYETFGATALLRGPGNGIPYKIYAVTAPAHSGPATFALLTIPARLQRLALSWLAFTALGWIFKNWIRRHRDTTALLFTIFWIIVYAIYWSVI